MIISYLVFYFIRQPRSSKTFSVIHEKHDFKESLPIQLTSNEFSEKYQRNRGQIKGGTLCFWGHWFGKPYDNLHVIKKVVLNQSENTLIIYFNEQEILTVYNPVGIEEYPDKIKIINADKVRWQWFYYGREKEDKNLMFYEIVKDGNNLIGYSSESPIKTNWDDLTLTKPAILLT